MHIYTTQDINYVVAFSCWYKYNTSVQGKMDSNISATVHECQSHNFHQPCPIIIKRAYDHQLA